MTKGASLVLLSLLGMVHPQPRNAQPTWSERHDENGQRKLAAMAFRDRVPDYQRVGSKNFTLNYLNGQVYDQVEYLEEDTLGFDSESRFVATLSDLLEHHEAVDLFLLVNGAERFPSWVAEVPTNLLGKLRLVYSTGGDGKSQIDGWQRLGVGAYVYHPGTSDQDNLAPFFYVDFLRNWTSGERLDQAVTRANESFHKRLHGLSTLAILRAQDMPTDEASLERWDHATQARWVGRADFAVR
jgi:hypothetical protein